MNELDRLLERVTREPAYGPAFYAALLAEPVYVLIPAGAVFTPKGTVRFVMWTGADGQRAIPFFSNRRAIGRVLTPETQALRLGGRTFLEASQGAIVVLNPNERLSCRLTAQEVDLLLATGAPSAAELYVTPKDLQMVMQSPQAPAEMLHSLTLLLSQYPEVDRAFLVTLQPADDPVRGAWLIAALIDSDACSEQVAHQMSTLLSECPPPCSVDLLCLKPGERNTLEIEANVAPFYDRSFGAKVLMDASAALH